MPEHDTELVGGVESTIIKKVDSNRGTSGQNTGQSQNGALTLADDQSCLIETNRFAQDLRLSDVGRGPPKKMSYYMPAHNLERLYKCGAKETAAPAPTIHGTAGPTT